MSTRSAAAGQRIKDDRTIEGLGACIGCCERHLEGAYAGLQLFNGLCLSTSVVDQFLKFPIVLILQMNEFQFKHTIVARIDEPRPGRRGGDGRRGGHLRGQGSHAGTR
jgi:hypothetical protein